MKKTLVLLVAITTLINCSSDDDNTSSIQIRLSNVSPYNFENIVVNTTTVDVSFENINSGETSDYKTFERAYRYGFVELQINGETYTIQPIDYVGESLLKTGKYTYEINANDSQEQYGKLSLTLIED